MRWVDFQSRSTSAAADQAAGQSASDLQPLGVTAQAGATVAIYAELPSDATVYVVPTQFYGESGVWKGTPVALENGRNYITVQQIGSLGGRGGPLYITYSGSHPEQIKLQVRVVNNAWEMPVLELSDWYSMGESARKDAIRTYVQELSSYVAALPTSATGKGNWGIAHEIGHNMDKLGNLGSEAKSNEVRVAYDKTISSDLYDLSRQDGTITITMKNGASVPVTGIKVTGTGLSGSYTVKVKANAGADWTTAKTGTLSDDTVVAYFTKPGAAESDTRIWTYDAAVLEITGIPEDATVQLLDYTADGAVSDTSDGFFIFVPDLESEKELNKQDGVTDDYPLEIRAVFYRTDDPNNAESKRVTSETLWISFPGEDDLPLIDQKSDLSELN